MGTAKLLVKKAKREFVKELDREVTISKPAFYYVPGTDKDFHTAHGMIHKKDLKKKDGARILSSTGKEFLLLSASFIDKYRRMKRAAQIITPKDIATILAVTGMNHKTRVVDAGTGSGALACFLANIAEDVTSYEVREDFYEVAKQNREFLGLSNLKLKKKDVCKGIEEKEVDLIVLDLPEPWRAIPTAEKALKVGGFLVAYNPSISQISEFLKEIGKRETFLLVKTVETIERDWLVEGRRLRPESQPIGHTGFLAFVRKLR